MNRYQRRASAPCLSRMVQGSTTLPSALGHLAAFAVEDVAQAEHVLVAGVAGEQGADGQQAVEPAPGLVDGLADEVGREALLEHLLVLEGIVPLGDGHGAGVEPGVDDGGHPARLGAALGAGEGDLVDVGAVQFEAGEIAAGQLAQLLPGADRRCRGRRRSARRAAACPSSGRGRATSRCCSPATCRSGRA